MELTNNYAKKYNEDQKEQYKNDYGDGWYFIDKSLRYCLTQEYINPEYVLIIKDFNSTTTTKEQLITIFRQSNIKIVFIDELLNDFIEKKEEACILTLREEKITEENKILIKKLLEAEDKIKLLEEEIQKLKTQKQSKNIKDFYKKI